MLDSLDRRHSPRIVRRMPAHIGAAHHRLPAVTCDASITGVLLTSEGPLEVGQRVTLTIEMGDEVHLVVGYVVRCKAEDGRETHEVAIELEAPAHWASNLSAA